MWTIYLKEIRELLRDRKTFIFTIIIPIVIIPLLAAGFIKVQAVIIKRAETGTLSYAIIGKQYAPALARRFAQDPLFHEQALGSADALPAAIADGRIRFALVVPDDLEAMTHARRQGEIALYFNSASDGNIVRDRVTAIVDANNRALQEEALPALGLDAPTLRFAIKPIRIAEHSTADQRERIGSLAGGFLPYILLLVCLLAAMYPAMDLGAGEKERGTLETLLLAPVPRHQLVLAKFLVLFSFGLTSALLMVASAGVLLHVFASRLGAELGMLAASISTPELMMIAFMLVPPSAIFASILLALSIYAKTHKEAHGLIQPFMFVVFPLLMLATVRGVVLNWMWAMVPLTNVALAMKELVKGTMDYRMFAVIFVSTSVLAALLLAWCCRFFNREDVLFRT